MTVNSLTNKDYQTEELEKLAVTILKQCGIDCFQNNLEDKLSVDICTKDGVKIDVQYSNNYARYGDFRLDIISSYKPKQVRVDRDYKYNPNENIIKNFQKKYDCTVTKQGKILQTDYLDFFFILFYNTKYSTQNQNPDFILLISKEDLINYCKSQVKNLFYRIILNNKQTGFNDVGLKDEHGSAFIPLKVDDLLKYTNCIFDTCNNFMLRHNDVHQYLNQVTCKKPN